MVVCMLVLVCLALFSPLEVQAAAEVTAPAGRVAGLEQDVDGTTVNAFLGIPFAHPPVGERRFRRAERLEPWNGTYDATRKPNACIQTATPSIGNATLSEDCLYLNVWQPTPLPTAAAVMVWIHGGGFDFGWSTEEVYDGRYLAATEGVIVVSMNFRLSTLGFAYTGTDEAPGNMGLTDQLLALQWVKDNIASFGGDPSKVTIAGKGSGSASAGFHLLSPESRNVFNRAIMQSGTSLSQDWLFPATAISGKTKALAARLGCPTEQGPTAMMACLRQQDAQTLTAFYPQIYPVIDGSFLPVSASKALEDGDFKHTDILIGTNTNEKMMFLILLGYPGYSFAPGGAIDRRQFLENIKTASPDLNELAVAAAAFQYTDWLRPGDSDMYRAALDALETDRKFLCKSFAVARANTRVGTSAYMYEFAHRPSNEIYPDWAGVVHFAERPFVFGPVNAALGYTAEEAELSRRMMRHWANFARTGNPNENGESVWSPFTETSRGYLMFDTNAPRMVTGQKATECAFWDNYVPSLMNWTAEMAEPEPCQPVVESTTPALWGQSLAVALFLNVIKDVISFITSIFIVL